ncbi:hypothetical protein [Nonomuraea sp. KM90]|uniref:hypothetical protein n=1 Tax=Nonomuraea sp. KM90 TaxID=3457428 RepID=UPI003FCD556B
MTTDLPRAAVAAAETAMEHHLLNGNDTLLAEAAVRAAAPALMAEGMRAFAAYLEAHPMLAPVPSSVYAQLARERAEHMEAIEDQEGDDCFTAAELASIDLTIRLAEKLGQVVGDGPTRANDMRELLAHVHGIQNALMAQATARLYPERFRLLGGVVDA